MNEETGIIAALAASAGAIAAKLVERLTKRESELTREEVNFRRDLSKRVAELEQQNDALRQEIVKLRDQYELKITKIQETYRVVWDQYQILATELRMLRERLLAYENHAEGVGT